MDLEAPRVREGRLFDIPFISMIYSTVIGMHPSHFILICAILYIVIHSICCHYQSHSSIFSFTGCTKLFIVLCNEVVLCKHISWGVALNIVGQTKDGLCYDQHLRDVLLPLTIEAHECSIHQHVYVFLHQCASMILIKEGL